MLEVFFDLVLSLGYTGIFFYMILVGTFIPLPTQIILIPVGILVSQDDINLISISIIATLGTTLGSLINYFLSKKISQKLMSKAKLSKINFFFKKYGKLAIILAPLSFGMGQYISIPAGIAQMSLKWFIPLVFISNFVWNFSMIMLGYLYGQKASESSSYLFLGVGIILIMLIVTIKIYKEMLTK